jgi:hypothetical protein
MSVSPKPICYCVLIGILKAFCVHIACVVMYSVLYKLFHAVCLFSILLLVLRGHAIAQAVSHWPLTAEARVCTRVDSCGFVVDKVALWHVFLRVLQISPANIIPPLFHIHLSPPHEVCDSSDQAARYHHFGPKLGASFLTRHIGWKQNKKVKFCHFLWKGYLQLLSPVTCSDSCEILGSHGSKMLHSLSYY